MAHVRTPRSTWVDAGLEALAAGGGPDAVRVEALAASLGVSKGGFYWHFSDRGALLDEMLEAWEKTTVEDVIARVEREPPDPRARLQRMFELASSLSLDGLALELAIRGWARQDAGVAARLHRVDNRRMGYLRDLFAQFCKNDDDVEARSMLAFSLFIGSHFVAAEHGDRTRAEVVQLAADRLLSESWA